MTLRALRRCCQLCQRLKIAMCSSLNGSDSTLSLCIALLLVLWFDINNMHVQ